MCCRNVRKTISTSRLHYNFKVFCQIFVHYSINVSRRICCVSGGLWHAVQPAGGVEEGAGEEPAREEGPVHPQQGQVGWEEGPVQPQQGQVGWEDGRVHLQQGQVGWEVGPVQPQQGQVDKKRTLQCTDEVMICNHRRFLFNIYSVFSFIKP